jgi:hypothetical protein
VQWPAPSDERFWSLVGHPEIITERLNGLVAVGDLDPETRAYWTEAASETTPLNDFRGLQGPLPQAEPFPGPAVFPDVLVVSTGEAGWALEIEGRSVFLNRAQIEPGSSVPAVGQRGAVTVAVHAVADVYEAFRRAAPPLVRS